MRRTVIGVMGSGDNASAQAVAWAEELGALIADEGWALLSGGRNAGVMHAVSRGARSFLLRIGRGLLQCANSPTEAIALVRGLLRRAGKQ